MKDYKEKRWICNECEWDWITLSAGDDTTDEEQCPNCNSFDIRESDAKPRFEEYGKAFKTSLN